MKYTVILESAQTSETGAGLALTKVELEAATVKEVRALARTQHPGLVVKKVRRQKQQATNAA